MHDVSTADEAARTSAYGTAQHHVILTGTRCIACALVRALDLVDRCRMSLVDSSVMSAQQLNDGT